MISIIHPTRGRKQQALNTCAKWLRLADKPHEIEYIISIDASDSDKWCSIVKMLPKVTSNVTIDVTVLKNDSNTAISAINFAANRATGDLFIVISDDTDCPENWDTMLLEKLKGKSDFCAKVDDGLQPTLVTMPIMDRVYYERYGYIYHPDFKHLHADEELTCVAFMTGKYIKIPLLFRHLHYSTGLTKKDAINEKNDATWSHGQRTLDAHAKNNFGIKNPVMRREDILWR